MSCGDVLKKRHLAAGYIMYYCGTTVLTRRRWKGIICKRHDQLMDLYVATERERERDRDRQTDRHTDRRTYRDRETETQTETEVGRQADRQIDRQTHGQTETYTETRR